MLLDIVKADFNTFRAKPGGPNGDILRRICSNVTVFDRELYDFTQNMVETMFAANGVGLAAPQVGVGFNVFVMRAAHGLANNTHDVHIFINPQTTSYSEKETYQDMEGCLSIPNLLGRVKRYKTVKFEYVDPQGKPQGASVSGLPARIFQHENDHLLGVLFTDRADQCYRPVQKEDLELDSTDE